MFCSIPEDLTLQNLIFCHQQKLSSKSFFKFLLKLIFLFFFYKQIQSPWFDGRKPLQTLTDLWIVRKGNIFCIHQPMIRRHDHKRIIELPA